MSSLKTNYQTLYETDYYQWINTTIEKLRNQDYGNVDWENLIEEIEDISRSERKSLKSNLIVVLLHLLKWQFQPDRKRGSWAGSIVEHQRRIKEDVLKKRSKIHLVFNLISKAFLLSAIPKQSNKQKLKLDCH